MSVNRPRSGGRRPPIPRRKRFPTNMGSGTSKSSADPLRSKVQDAEVAIKSAPANGGKESMNFIDNMSTYGQARAPWIATLCHASPAPAPVC